MSNHPNRGPKGPQSSPVHDQILALLATHNIDQKNAAELIWYSHRAMIKWCRGERKMPQCAWWALQKRLLEVSGISG
jgi:hypothetical protein